MKEFVEKLIGRLEEYKDTHLIEHDSEECLHCSENEDDWCNCRDCFICVWDKAKAIVKELEQEYNNGWIPCSEELPEVDVYVLCQGNHSMFIACVDSLDNKWRDCHFITRTTVKAWQPLPQPYKPQKLEWKDKVMKHFTNVE